jgi:hypothetical protein
MSEFWITLESIVFFLTTGTVQWGSNIAQAERTPPC